jgi:hypothetical protein
MDANERLHRDWLGMAQPEGLVVSLAALKAAEANLSWPVTELQAQLQDLVVQGRVLDLPALLRDLLGWSDALLDDASALPPRLSVAIEEGDRLAPSFALRSADDDAHVFLVSHVSSTAPLDAAQDERRWSASAHQRFERLLRETGVSVGLLTNGKEFRLVYAPRGESAGWITFHLAEMLSVDGRPLLGAFHMLLNERRLLTLSPERRLLGLLQASRAYQSSVSTALREQVLGALRTLLQGFQAADLLASGKLLQPYRGEAMREVYLGLVTVLMRMVFVLFAEERDLLPMNSELYAESYSLTRLHAQLTRDRGAFGDGLDNRYGAWARVLTLFRVLHDGLRTAGGLRLPPREGKLFNPDEFPFLEGRPRGSARQKTERLQLPRVSDGAVFRVLDQLLVLGGERLQYKGLDVEQIGSVYEGLMGFELEYAQGDSLCLSPDHVVVNLETLLKLPGAERIKQLKAEANLDLKDRAASDVKAASSVQTLLAALGRRISPRQPGLLPAGTLFMQPGEERRRSGSHYTPRSLTQPIVETTLRPVLERLRRENLTPPLVTLRSDTSPIDGEGGQGGEVSPSLTPDQILSLKICDPAMGSGAFLVEVCRQLADHLVAAWRRTGTMPELPPDEDPLLHARRLVAQRCLYGVDKNPLAVDLARLSMWLVTFAREHPFTFVDHALRAGDSLVGLSKDQICDLTPYPLSLEAEGEEKGKKKAEKGAKAAKTAGGQLDLVRPQVVKAVEKADQLRQQIHAQGDPPDNAELQRLWKDTNDALARVRLLGDLVVAAYFGADSDKARKTALDHLRAKVQHWLSTGELEAELQGMVAELREGERPLEPFHWEIEFPEVFGRENPGFDCFVGNPPFAGKNTISAQGGERYIPWLQVLHEEAHGNADLSAHFFRRVFTLLSRHGTFGLIATNTIAQGDTRVTGLQFLLDHGVTLYNATRRLRWPGVAAVIVSVVHGEKRPPSSLGRGECRLDAALVPRISAFLFPGNADHAPAPLPANENKSFVGSYVLGMGFTFDDSNPDATPLAEMHRLLKKDPRNAARIFPYLGGEELNSSPTQSHHRFVIHFGQMSEDEARQWPDLMAIVERKVKPERDKLADNADGRRRRQYWWQWGRYTPALYEAIRPLKRVLACSQVSAKHCIGLQPIDRIFAHTLNVFVHDSLDFFAVLQSSAHELWARFFGSSLEDRLRYTPTDCFETFPFPPALYPLKSPPPSPTLDALEAIGKEYYEFRAALMADEAVRATLMDGLPPEGLTKTYNKFHDPDCHLPGIVKLRELHAQMDRAVLDAYGWQDIRPAYDFREQLDESVRLTWAEETRDEVLARLLELNRVMAETSPPPAPLPIDGEGGVGKAKKGRGVRKKKDDATLALPGSEEGEAE